MSWQYSRANANPTQLEREIRATDTFSAMPISVYSSENDSVTVIAGCPISDEESEELVSLIEAHVPDWTERDRSLQAASLAASMIQAYTNWDSLDQDGKNAAAKALIGAYLMENGLI